MGFRFRKSIKVAPGVRLNLSKSGTSWSIGRKGAMMNLKGRRTRITLGLPGTGLSYTATNTAQRAARDLAHHPEPVSHGGRFWRALKVSIAAWIGCGISIVLAVSVGIKALAGYPWAQPLLPLVALPIAAAVTVAGLQTHRYGRIRSVPVWRCDKCGYAGKPSHPPRAWVIWEWVAWSLVYPGLGLTLYRTFTGRHHCPNCQSISMTPSVANDDN
jgi:hypothetical protein